MGTHAHSAGSSTWIPRYGILDWDLQISDACCQLVTANKSGSRLEDQVWTTTAPIGGRRDESKAGKRKRKRRSSLVKREEFQEPMSCCRVSLLKNNTHRKGFMSDQCWFQQVWGWIGEVLCGLAQGVSIPLIRPCYSLSWPIFFFQQGQSVSHPESS